MPSGAQMGNAQLDAVGGISRIAVHLAEKHGDMPRSQVAGAEPLRAIATVMRIHADIVRQRSFFVDQFLGHQRAEAQGIG